jgi:hypothetical protein
LNAITAACEVTSLWTLNAITAVAVTTIVLNGLVPRQSTLVVARRGTGTVEAWTVPAEPCALPGVTGVPCQTVRPAAPWLPWRLGCHLPGSPLDQGGR